MLGTLRMNLDDTIDGLLTLADSLFPQSSPEIIRTSDENLEILKDAIGQLLNRHELPKDIKLGDHQLRASKSKV
jgi:hypothetical protein